MKRRDLLRRLADSGCVFVRSGGRHDVYRNPATNRSTPVPRHTEIADTLCRQILKQLGIADQPID